MSMSNTAENKVLKALLQGTDIDFRASANLYLALFTADPTEAGVFTNEANYTGYARVAMPKASAWTDVATNYTDMSYSAGTPIANYYASSPLVFTTLNGNEGIFKGVGVDKLLHKVTIHDNSVNPTLYQLLDYVMYAPFVDFDSTDELTGHTLIKGFTWLNGEWQGTNISYGGL